MRRASAQVAPSTRGGRKDLVILSSVRWNFTWQRHQAVARAAAQSGYAVTFVEPMPRSIIHLARGLARRLRRDPNALHRVQPLPSGVEVVPFAPLDLFPGRRRNRIVAAVHARPVVLAYVPSVGTARLARKLRPRKFIYDNVIDWSAAPKSWSVPRNWEQVEAEFEMLAAETGGALVSDSANLLERSRSRGVRRGVVEPAADDEFVELPRRLGKIQAAGYFGSVRYEEVDVERMVQIVKSGIAVEVIGPVDSESARVLERGGVVIRGSLPISELLDSVRDWDAIILPYRITERTRTLVPAKIWNCIATGRPVFSAGLRLPEGIAKYVRDLDQLAMAETEDHKPVVIPRWSDRLVEIVADGDEEDD